MLEYVTDGSIREISLPLNQAMTATNGIDFTIYPSTYWYTYPIYICTDKTKKSIEILKMLQKKKKIRCDSVDKFIELVEEISSIL